MLLSPPLMAFEALPFTSSETTTFGPSLSPPLTGLKRTSTFAKSSKPKRTIDFSKFGAARAASSALHQITAGLPSPPQQVLELKMPSSNKHDKHEAHDGRPRPGSSAFSKRARVESEDEEADQPAPKRQARHAPQTNTNRTIRNNSSENVTVGSSTEEPSTPLGAPEPESRPDDVSTPDWLDSISRGQSGSSSTPPMAAATAPFSDAGSTDQPITANDVSLRDQQMVTDINKIVEMHFYYVWSPSLRHKYHKTTTEAKSIWRRYMNAAMTEFIGCNDTASQGSSGSNDDMEDEEEL